MDKSSSEQRTANRKRPTANPQPPKKQGRSGGSNPSGLRFPLATFGLRVFPALARYVRGASAPSGLEGARPVLMILWDTVSEKFLRLQEFDFFSHPRRQDD